MRALSRALMLSRCVKVSSGSEGDPGSAHGSAVRGPWTGQAAGGTTDERQYTMDLQGARSPVPLQAGGVVVDPWRRTCSRNGISVALTAREFAVLATLVRRAPGVVSKQQLVDVVWGMDFDGDPNIVEVYVGYLRRKLAAAGDKRPVIATVRGEGYRIGDP